MADDCERCVLGFIPLRFRLRTDLAEQSHVLERNGISWDIIEEHHWTLLGWPLLKRNAALTAGDDTNSSPAIPSEFRSPSKPQA
jgi:hypothetical protein